MTPYLHGNGIPCKTCAGTGRFTDQNGHRCASIKCPACKGIGKRPRKPAAVIRATLHAAQSQAKATP